MVRGLTTYIFHRSDIFFKDYELPHNSFLIIDGNSVAVNIYIQLKNKNNCFGGDYDKYADAIRVFFKKLSDGKVTPYVLFDGATKPEKVETAIKRLRQRIQKTIEINCSNQHETEIFPLFLIEVFKGIVKELNIAMVMCDFDCDREVANIAHQLNCPVLSYDSDYFIYDVKYIPFMLIDNEPNLYVFRRTVKDRVTKQESTLKYLRCKIFNRQTFLKRTGLAIEKLPILTVFLGNDFIERVQNVPQFCRFLNMKPGNFVNNIINWLVRKTSMEAINKMVDYYRNESKKKHVKSLIEQSIEEYTCRESHYFEYLQPTSVFKIRDNSSIFLKNFSKTFVYNYRRGLYHYQILDILLFHKYYPKPLVENINNSHSHTLSFPIINAVHQILTGKSTQDLKVYGRVGSDISEQVIHTLVDIDIPSFDQVHQMNIKEKLNEFLKILEIEKVFKQDCLDLFPNSWHMFLITLKYMSKKHQIELAFIYAMVMSKIILSYVDEEVGFIRSWRDFDKYSSKFGVEQTEKNRKFGEVTHIVQALKEIDKIDSLKVLEKFLTNFEISSEMKDNVHLFNKNLVHLMSEFQSCFLHIDYLNDIFDMPFEKCQIWKFYNGTFIYNLFRQLQNNLNFIQNSLEASPTILRGYEFIINQLKTHIA